MKFAQKPTEQSLAVALTGVCHGAQYRFARLLSQAMQQGPIEIDHYHRYLSMQYHLTKGVQRYFIEAAAHPDLARRRRLRQFLVDFANEEEQHYLVAAHDLHRTGLAPLPASFDVELWHTYFRSTVRERPFLRLGAACVLENISAGEAKSVVRKALQAPFLNRDNTKFLVLHQHETLPHGEQIIAALMEANLESRHIADLLEGSRKGAILYLRMAEWALFPDCDAALVDGFCVASNAEDRTEIESFSMEQLQG